MGKSFLAGLTGFFRSWRGAPVENRPQLMRRMASQMGAPKESLDGDVLSTCVYCEKSSRCQGAFDAGNGKDAEKFCPNAPHFRAAGTAQS